LAANARDQLTDREAEAMLLPKAGSRMVAVVRDCQSVATAAQLLSFSRHQNGVGCAGRLALTKMPQSANV